MVQFNYEYERRLRVGYVGAGGHSYRNLLPALQYAPIELVALADTNTERGLAVARQFGARHFYPNHKAMFAKEEMDAVFVASADNKDARNTNRLEARARLHTWMEAPLCATLEETYEFTEACMVKNRYLAVGLNKMFASVYIKALSVMASRDFGGVSSFALRYPAAFPAAELRNNPAAILAFLEVLRPYSILVRLFGEAQGLSFMRSKTPASGGVVSLRYRSGVVGTLHLTGGQAATSPLERLEVIGNGANLVAENGSRLIYYRPGGTRGLDTLSQEGSFAGPDDSGPVFWEPDYSRGEVYNKQLFMEGYVGCIREFADCLLRNQPPRLGNLMNTIHMYSVIDHLRNGREDTLLRPS
jgi:predicted dehydrogenase